MTQNRILLVEDEALIVMMLEDILGELGYVCAAHASSVVEAMAAIEDHSFDAAILDVNLGNERSWPVARQLDALGVPYLLSTGNSIVDIPPEFAHAPYVRKPYAFDSIERGLAGLLDPAA